MKIALVCDFCCVEPIRWRYPARDFISNEIAESIGAWAACDICHRLIESNDRAGLAVRCADTAHDFPIPETDRISMAQRLHSLFFKNRTGPCEVYCEMP